MRPAGSLVKHPPKVLHGVESLRSGTRKGLFVVDQSNGLGEIDVIVVTHKNVADFVESLRPRVPDCVVCQNALATHTPVPCGHFCLCATCALQLESTTKKCPVCQDSFQFTMKNYL